MTAKLKSIGTKQKALQINLDRSIYGSFAEIGAGQDVAANFFKAGGASGTIAKTISAYDMAFSDAIYGEEESGKYVCEPRLMKMLNREFKLLKVRLTESADEKRFFSFADTVSALNYQKDNDAHGWVGLRFQLSPNGPVNDVVIHINMLDNDNILQQQALGIIGVNLIYGCYHYHADPEKILVSLLDDLSPDRIEIDMIRFEGPDFKDVDNRLMSLYLVKHGFTQAALFGPDGNVMQPYDALSKKHIVAIRGRFRPVTNIFSDMVKKGIKQFENEADIDDDKICVVSELTLRNLENEGNHINEKDFLDRVDILCSLGQTVLISNFHEYFKLVAYLSKFSRLKMALIMGMPNLDYIFEEKHYTQYPGGILTAFASLFGLKIKLYLYPTLDENGQLINLKSFQPEAHLTGLFQYLLDNEKLADIHSYDENLMKIRTDRVLDLIQQGSGEWENLVPSSVVKLIKEKALFGYPEKSLA
ncbi:MULTISPECIES: TonB-dependent receptor [Aquirufa]|uniref:TonB-dependent receptor n=2 Tax=Aquirufa TaxID=2676247 RepID=A0ABT4JFZ1_9BACT|nr:TonB-dependent receptor [Aquirufa ecclesiirivi]MCZ2475201.1 TonB-dependent receptor [Aquirufa ecclesiirivi]NHC48235.1 TonB-dependent receptor [Aquirufa ecclesiirivi]